MTRSGTFFFYCYRHHQDLHSFPTRRSSDLFAENQRVHQGGTIFGLHREPEDRSEEHTSELQSLRHLVCRLLLEKKKPHAHGWPPGSAEYYLEHSMPSPAALLRPQCGCGRAA